MQPLPGPMCPGSSPCCIPTCIGLRPRAFPITAEPGVTRRIVDKLLVPLMRDWDNFSAVADDFIAKDDRVVCLGTYAGVNKATGKAMRATFAHVWQVADDKLARFDMYTDTLLVRQAME